MIESMFEELFSNPATQWVYGIAGTAILIAIAYYVLGNMRKEIRTPMPTEEDHLIEFERMHRTGVLNAQEFRKVKKQLGAKIVEKAKSEFEKSEDEDEEETEKEADSG